MSNFPVPEIVEDGVLAIRSLGFVRPEFRQFLIDKSVSAVEQAAKKLTDQGKLEYMGPKGNSKKLRYELYEQRWGDISSFPLVLCAFELPWIPHVVRFKK